LWVFCFFCHRLKSPPQGPRVTTFGCFFVPPPHIFFWWAPHMTKTPFWLFLFCGFYHPFVRCVPVLGLGPPPVRGCGGGIFFYVFFLGVVTGYKVSTYLFCCGLGGLGGCFFVFFLVFFFFPRYYCFPWPPHQHNPTPPTSAPLCFFSRVGFFLFFLVVCLSPNTHNRFVVLLFLSCHLEGY